MQKNYKALLVEDDYVTVETLRCYLEDVGCEVVGDAMRAEEALCFLERGEADIAVLDIRLKGEKDGIWLAGQIRDRFKIPFVFLSARSDPATVAAAARTCPAAFLVKPIAQADFYAALEGILVKCRANAVKPMAAPRPGESSVI